ncbi:uncharacterized protein TNCT_527451 [Trichonephila clavata]|uniref:Uncharacterized protein n=1 Tax=Trichonephila clavata TaxID=2740835 RepID=A0A8X6GWK3_TRICU|nr:uncharacterized protein TNCT_527451 [Trichonephila clavata]
MGDDSECHYRLVSLGGAAVGKSSILKRFLFGTYCDRHRPTVEDLYSREFDIAVQEPVPGESGESMKYAFDNVHLEG